MEEVNARASNNKVLFRFAILESKSYDLVDVVVRRNGSECGPLHHDSLYCATYR
jgi:hypothetical protein